MRASLVRLAVALSLLAGSPARAATGEASWDSRAWALKASGLPASAVTDRPDWGDQQVTLDGKLVWVVAIVPTSAKTWSDRLFIGSRQAADTLGGYIEYLVRSRSYEEPADYRERQVVSALHRLKASFDAEGFLKVETAERPRAIWMRFGYPAEKVQYVLGFDIPGALPLDKPRQPRAAREPAPVHSPWDYVWDVVWVAGVATVTAAAMLFAQATQK